MSDEADALPPGLVPLPELGPDVVGTRVSPSARWVLKVKAGAWLVLAAVALGFAVQGITMAAGLVLGLLFTAACAFMATGSIALLRLGDRPALTVDATSLHCHIPMSRADVRLAAVTRVRRIRRDLLIEALGGISREGRTSRARWVAITGAHTFEVSRDDLVAYLSGRATASRAPA